MLTRTSLFGRCGKHFQRENRNNRLFLLVFRNITCSADWHGRTWFGVEWTHSGGHLARADYCSWPASAH
jgi:hypothetical protein